MDDASASFMTDPEVHPSDDDSVSSRLKIACI
jgi:hypothetical protein